MADSESGLAIAAGAAVMVCLVIARLCECSKTAEEPSENAGDGGNALQTALLPYVSC